MKIFFLILFSVPLFAGFSTSSQVDTAIVINGDTGAILYQKNAHKQVYPASITKIATALYALDHYKPSLDQVIEIGPSILKMATMHDKKRYPDKFPPYALEPDGTSMRLVVGESIPLRTLFYGLMIASGNDAANAIAAHCAGTIPQFVEDMNRYLKSIGCQNTHFMNPHGLHHPEHVTTAYDLAIITKKAMSFPIFAQIVKTITYPRGDTNRQKSFPLWQNNKMMRAGPYFYDKALGVKKGYTSIAGHNLVSAASNGERYLIAVVLGVKDRNIRYTETINLFEEAFNEKKVTQRIFAQEADVFQKQIKGACEVLKAYLPHSVEVSYYPSEPYQLTSKVRWLNQQLPIMPHMCVGVVEVFDQVSGRLVASGELKAKNFVGMTKTAQVGLWLRQTSAYIRAHKYKMACALSCFIAAYAVASRSRVKGCE